MQVLQQAAKAGQLQQLLSQHSHSLQRHAKQLLKRVGHDTSGQQLGAALLPLAVAAAGAGGPQGLPSGAPSSSTTEPEAQARQLVAAVGTKHLLRFASTGVVQAAIDAQLVSAADALQQACRRDPGCFLRLLEDNLHQLHSYDASKVGGSLFCCL